MSEQDQRDDQAGDDRTPLEQVVEHAVDVFVYAPIGLLFEGASVLPQLVEKGKSQVTMAKVVGQFALKQGRGEGEKLAAGVAGGVLGLLAKLGQSPSAHPPAVPDAPVAASSAPVTTSLPAPAAASRDGAAPDPVGAVGGTDRAAGAAIDADTLAIPDYDGLSASHVVNRLAGLSAAELEAVRLYELANRGRKTILSKVAQLQAG
jgi:hypothetical protein